MSALSERLSSVPGAARWRAMPAMVPGLLLVAAGYYFGSLVGFHLRFPSSAISFFWPPTAILTAALLLAAPRTWGALLAAAFVAHAVAHGQNGVALAAWPVQFLANAAQALLAAVLIRRFSDAQRPFANLRRASAFIGACIVAPAIASLVVASVYVSQTWAESFVNAWTARTVSNAIGALTIVPPILMAWPYLRSKPVRPAARHVLELTVLFAGILATHVIVRHVSRHDAMALALALYAPAPFLLWATVRFGGLGLSVALLVTTLLTMSSALRGEGAFVTETPLEAVVGVQLFVAVTAVPLMLIAGLLEQNRDEHAALVEMERQNSATLRALPDLIFVQTRDGVYLRHYAKNAAELLVPPETFLGKNMRDILPPDLVEQFAPAFQTVTVDEPHVSEYSLVINGSRRHYEARFIGIDGDRVLSLVRDITERQRSEDALKHANETLARMGRISALAELSASIAHELNQPLAAIATNANACLRWLAADAPDADLRGALKDVVADSHRASRIVRRTTEMFANRPAETTTVDVPDIVRDVVELTGIRVRKDGVRLETEIDAGVPAVDADGVQIKQVLLNLVLNAVDALLEVHDRTRVLRIVAAQHEHGAMIAVSDNGCGLAPADVDRVFEPFYTTKADGIGIGLAISRSIVTSYGGELWAETNPTGGATFCFTLPARES